MAKAKKSAKKSSSGRRSSKKTVRVGSSANDLKAQMMKKFDKAKDYFKKGSFSKVKDDLNRWFYRNNKYIIPALGILIILLFIWRCGASSRNAEINKQINKYETRAEKYPNDPDNYKALMELYEKLGDDENEDKYYDLYQQAKKASESKDGTDLAELARLLERYKSGAQPSRGQDPSRGDDAGIGDDDDGGRRKTGTTLDLDALEKEGADKDKLRASKLFNEGVKLFNKGQFAPAKKKFKGAIDIKNDFADPYSYLGDIYYQEKDQDEALKNANKALDLDDTQDRAYFVKGEINRDGKNFGKAEDNYRKAVEYNQGNCLAYYRLGGLMFIKPDYNKAKELYHKCIQCDDSYYKAYINLGMSLLKLKNNNAAIRVMNEALKQKEIMNDSTARRMIYSKLGYAYNLNRDHENAIKYYKKAVAIKKTPNDYFQLGLIYEEIRQFDDAKKSYVSALEVKSTYWEANFNLGNIYLNQNRYDEAIKYFNRVLQEKLDHAPTFVNAGKCYLQMEKMDKAKQYFDKAIRIDPKEPTANIELAKYWKKKGVMDKAVHFAKAALNNEKVEDDKIIYYNELGLIYKQFKLNDEAEKMFQTARDIHPSNNETLQNLGQLYLDLNRFEDAEGIYEVIVKVNAKNYDAWYILGTVQDKLGKPDAAKETFQKLLQLKPNYKKKSEVQSYINSH